MSFLYGEFEPGDGPTRRDVSRHLAECPACASELAALGGVREQLAAWTTPEAELGFQIVQSPLRDVSRPRADDIRTGLRRWTPAWIPASGGLSSGLGRLPMAAAAVLVLGAALGLARLDVQYDSSGLRVRTGWGHNGSPSTVASGGQVAPLGVSLPGAGASPAAQPVTAADLAALEAKWRRELASSVMASSVAGPAVADASTTTLSPAAEAAVLKRLRQIIEESEVRQQQNLQLRVAELSRDFQMRRQADLVQIEQGFGKVAVDNAAQRQMIREYFRNVSLSGASPRPQQ